MIGFTRYANLTAEDKVTILANYKDQRTLYPVNQAVSCTAVDCFVLSDRQWNGKIGADAFAATLAILVMERVITITDTREQMYGEKPSPFGVSGVGGG